MALFEVFLNCDRSHAHIRVEGAHLNFSWNLEAISKRLLALDWKTTTTSGANVKETHRILVHHAASTSQHTHNLKVSGFFVTETPCKRCLKFLTQGNATCQDQTVVRPEHRDHLQWSCNTHELWRLPTFLLTSCLHYHFLHFFRIAGYLAVEDFLKFCCFLFSSHALSWLIFSISLRHHGEQTT